MVQIPPINVDHDNGELRRKSVIYCDYHGDDGGGDDEGMIMIEYEEYAFGL